MPSEISSRTREFEVSRQLISYRYN